MAALLALVAAGVAVALVLEARSDRETRERAARERLVVAERARITVLQRPHRGAARRLRSASGASSAERLAARAALVGAVEAAITADARTRAAAGELKGPISDTECGPLLKDPKAIPDDRVLAKTIGRYDCVAIKRDVADAEGTSVGRLGYAFVTALDFRAFSFVWCRNTPAQGEAGSALAFVRLERACLAAKGRALGTGYIDVPGS